MNEINNETLYRVIATDNAGHAQNSMEILGKAYGTTFFLYDAEEMAEQLQEAQAEYGLSGITYKVIRA